MIMYNTINFVYQQTISHNKYILYVNTYLISGAKDVNAGSEGTQETPILCNICSSYEYTAIMCHGAHNRFFQETKLTTEKCEHKKESNWAKT